MALIEEIRNTRVAQCQLALWWLGQSGFVLKTGRQQTIYLDPYLSTKLERDTADRPEIRHIRMMDAPLNPSEINDADYIICSHNHGDHLDPETVVPLLRGSGNAKIIIPPAATSFVASLGIAAERIVPVGVGDELDLGAFTITAVPGKHNQFDYDPLSGYPYVGYLIKYNGIQIYHAGDTIAYPELAANLKPYRIDLALLPINGGDLDRINRGFMSNLQFWEAADLAAEIEAKLTVPVHFGMFTINTENVERFTDYITKKYPGLQYWVPRTGLALIYPVASSVR